MDHIENSFQSLSVSFVYEKHKNTTRDGKCLFVSLYYLSLSAIYFYPCIYWNNRGIEHKDIKTLRNQNVRCTWCRSWDIQSVICMKCLKLRISSDFYKRVQPWITETRLKNCPSHSRVRGMEAEWSPPSLCIGLSIRHIKVS